MQVRIFGVLILLGLLGANGWGQVQETPVNRGVGEAKRSLERLRHTVRILATQAHPDDEDGALLTYLARRYGHKVAIFSLTRGEGGANLIGPEMYDALGVLRNEEFLSATRWYGTDLMLARLADFGFSKRLDETMEHWERYQPLCEVVGAIRTFKPDIVISRFHGAARDGHGQHQASGKLTIEAFDAAADAAQCPQAGQPWKAAKLYLSTRGNEAATLQFDTGELDPLLGMTYREMAREGWNAHRSQAVGQQLAPRGSALSGLLLKKSNVGDDGTRLLQGIENALPENVRVAVEEAVAQYNFAYPERSLPALFRARDALARRLMQRDMNPDRFRFEEKVQEIEYAITQLLGVVVQATADPLRASASPFASRESVASVAPGDEWNATVQVTNRGAGALKVLGVALESASIKALDSSAIPEAPLLTGQQASVKWKLQVASEAGLSKPALSRGDHFREFAYEVAPGQLYAAEPKPVASARVLLEWDGRKFEVRAPLQTVHSVPPAGEHRELLKVLPAVGVTLQPEVLITRRGVAGTTKVRVSLISGAKSGISGAVRLDLPPGYKATPATQNFQFARQGERQTFAFEVAIPATASGDAEIRAVAQVGSQEFREGYQMVAHPGLEPRAYFQPAVGKVRAVNVAVDANVRIGYIEGSGDQTATGLEQLGYAVTRLGETDLRDGDLSKFDTIVVGIRAYAVRNDLRTYNQRLLEWVNRGGNLVVQYQTQEYDQAAFGPYPFQLTPRAEETSEEAAKVTILDLENGLWKAPNRITEADFENWVEERGSKFMMQFDAKYTALVETHDRNDPPQNGVLLRAAYGKGMFTYCALALYRQVPAGVEGGYRLLANLVSPKAR